MGVVSSRLDEGAALFMRDQTRLSLASLVISSAQKRTSINISPNAAPASRITASRSNGGNVPVEYVQDPEAANSPVPDFLVKIDNDEDLTFTFTFTIRQAPGAESKDAADTSITGLTFVHGSTSRDVDNLVTREFHADPNLHKNPRVELIGDFNTGGSPAVTFDWAWKWKPPKPDEDSGGGWRNTGSFVEYDQRAHALQTLASFSFWVQNTSRYAQPPLSPTDNVLLSVPPRHRMVSNQSIESRASNSETEGAVSPPTYSVIPVGAPAQDMASIAEGAEQVKVDLSGAWPVDEVSATEDGPVFRAAMKQLEERTGSMRMQLKKMMKRAEVAHQAQLEANEAFSGFIEALKGASSTNKNAVQPAIDNYFNEISREISKYESKNAYNLQKIVIEPMNKVYQLDIKQAEAKKRDFEEESKEYYSYVGRYLGQRQDSVAKAKHSDSKYQNKRKNFELKRFDYASFMQDLSGGRKEQEVLSYLTKYADAQARAFLETAKKVETLLPRLDALSSEVSTADKEYQYQRKEREEKRRVLEKSNIKYNETAAGVGAGQLTAQAGANNGIGVASSTSDGNLNRANSVESRLTSTMTTTSISAAPQAGDLSRSPGSLGQSAMNSPQNSARFKGIRDLEERNASMLAAAEQGGSAQRKEGLLWALGRSNGHVDPRALNRVGGALGWHKFWIVLDGGRLSEYSNWKQKLDLHSEPIDLRTATVREARDAERRFCFEVITPRNKRVYQAPSEDDMRAWIGAINNALQSAVEGRGMKEPPAPSPVSNESGGFRKDMATMLTGKAASVGHHHAHHPAALPARRITVGARPGSQRIPSAALPEDEPDKLLQILRSHDEGNKICADCSSASKVEWVSINLAILLCIECSGIHRSLGTHVSKIRSLTLDVTSFTPDIVAMLLLIGNRPSNMVWEAKLKDSNAGTKLTAGASREERLRYITTKYVERAFVEPLSPTLSHSLSPDDNLLAAIKKNEIQQVIYALALKANPNVADRSRGTHPVYLALAAADPAPPNQQDMKVEPGTPNHPFPVAEMLLQNGAELPKVPSPFPLSRSAQAYMEGKRGKAAAAAATSGFGMRDVNEQRGMSKDQPMYQSNQDTRLNKRMSAGGRLAKAPPPTIPER